MSMKNKSKGKIHKGKPLQERMKREKGVESKYPLDSGAKYATEGQNLQPGPREKASQNPMRENLQPDQSSSSSSLLPLDEIREGSPEPALEIASPSNRVGGTDESVGERERERVDREDQQINHMVVKVLGILEQLDLKVQEVESKMATKEYTHGLLVSTLTEYDQRRNVERESNESYRYLQRSTPSDGTIPTGISTPLLQGEPVLGGGPVGIAGGSSIVKEGISLLRDIMTLIQPASDPRLDLINNMAIDIVEGSMRAVMKRTIGEVGHMTMRERP